MKVRIAVLTGIIGAVSVWLPAQETIKKEIDVAFSDLEEVRPILKEALSPVGKFVLLPHNGTVLVIDTPAGIAGAEAALASADFANPSIALGFRFVHGLPSKRTQIIVGQEVPLPTGFAPAMIIVEPYGGFTFVPAVPTRFETHFFGFISDTTQTINSDGSVTVKNSSLDSRIDYGAAIFPSGGIGVVPVSGAVGNPVFFSPFINAEAIPIPINLTTRISTAVVIRPRVELGKVKLDMIPRLRIGEENTSGESRYDPVEIDLRQFKTTLTVNNKQVGRAYGFTGASEEFNNRFFGAPDPYNGRSAVMVKVEIGPPVEKVPVPEVQEIKGTPQVLTPPSSPEE
ncbi:MAG: hypothetical protein P1U58_11555 [Verrucomicrobiales bacterium]|nr:hypothetical protein [Verrucomicrobiales bacterium]